MKIRSDFSYKSTLGVFLAALLMSLLIHQPARADYQAGLEAFNRAAYEEALPLFEEAAKEGSVKAQYYLGVIHAEGRGTTPYLPEAIYWLSCAGASDDSIAMNARRLKARLLRGLSTMERAEASSLSSKCPAPVAAEQETPGFSLFGPSRGYSGQTVAEGGFASFMETLRNNGVVSMFLLPGEVTIAVGREAASLVGAKQTAYAIDSTRLPGNDVLYILVVFFSWFLLYKVVMGGRALWQRFSEVAFVIEIRKERRQSLPKKKAEQSG